MEIEVKDEKETLVLFSGGIDSTAALLWMLDNTDDNIEAHHIILKTKQNRHELELQASDKIINWMTENKRPFKYTESIIDLGSEFGGNLDMYTYMWVAGMKAQQKLGNLDRVVTGRLQPFNQDISERRKHRTERVEAMFDILVAQSFDETEKIPEMIQSPILEKHQAYQSTPKIECFKPLLNMTKGEVISLLPKELLDMCFYCRKPIIILENGENFNTRFMDDNNDSIFDGHINDVKITDIVNCDDCHSCFAVRRSLGQMSEEEIDANKERMMD